MKPKLKLLTISIIILYIFYLPLLFLVIKVNRNSCASCCNHCCNFDVASITLPELYESDQTESQQSLVKILPQVQTLKSKKMPIMNLLNLSSIKEEIYDSSSSSPDSYYEEQALADLAIDRYLNDE